MKRISLLLAGLVICFTAAIQAPARGSNPAPEMGKLKVFLAHFTYEGESKTSPLGPGVKFSGEWDGLLILGGFFVQAAGIEHDPAGDTRFLEVWEYDPARREYVSRGYQDDGSTYTEKFIIKGTTIPVTGVLYTNGKRYLYRRTEIWSTDWSSATMKEEIFTYGKTWVPLYDARMTKAASGAKR